MSRNGQRSGNLRGLVGAVLPLAFVLAAGCAQSPSMTAGECGWDLVSIEGQQALRERLAFVSDWLVTHSGETPPVSTSPYWHGECPASSGDQAPPIAEHDDPRSG